MSDKETKEAEPEKKQSPVKSLLFSLVTAIVLGGIATGVIFVSPVTETQCSQALPAEPHETKKLTKSYKDAVFVNLDPLVVTLGPSAKSEYLKISVSLETTKDSAKSLEHLRPKFRDVLNTYLRAVNENDLADPQSMMRLRAQLLRRLQLVASSEELSDVLITEFILN